MASVLNKQTKAYYASVNTPDYPETDWIINPDLSQVQGTDPRYWVIDSAVQPVEVGTDPETLEPIFENRTVYTVRPMTMEERAAYDAANPTPTVQQRVALTSLTDGTPAYEKNGKLLSVNVHTLIFAVKVSNAKKFNVPFATTGSVYESDRNLTITKISISVTGTAAFDLVAKINGAEVHCFNVTDISYKFDNLDIDLAEGDTLAFAIDSAVDVSSPVILVDTSARN